MKRPRYESKDDMRREEEVVDRLIHLDGRNWTYNKLPISYGFDYALVNPDGLVKVMMEIKCRNMDWGDYPDIILSLSKYSKGMEYSKILKAFFVVSVTNGDIYQYQFGREANSAVEIKWGGRTKQTRDRADIEPVVLLPVKDFTFPIIAEEDNT